MSKFLLLGICISTWVFASFMTDPAAGGKVIYQKKCARCHGKDGSKGAFGAKNLQTSTMDDEAIKQIILNGKRVMPAYKTKLSLEEIESVSAYVKSLRN